MEELIKGHKYRLDNLKTTGTTDLQFFMDPKLHKGESLEGPSTQEVLRACIARVKALEEEKPHPFNNMIITKLREVIILFEVRALLNKADSLELEDCIVDADGHWSIG